MAKDFNDMSLQELKSYVNEIGYDDKTHDRADLIMIAKGYPDAVRARPFAENQVYSKISDKELLQIAKDYVSNPTPDQLSEDFIFRGPVIGPLCKKDFVATLSSVGSGEYGLTDAFPDLEPNNFGFSVDPIEQGRVWYFTRPRGTFDGPFDHPVNGRINPTGEKYVGPPEARSVIIDQDGKVKYQSVGYVVDRFTGDTTGGRGAVFGMYAVMGEELDDSIGSPFMVFLQWLSSVLPKSMGIPLSYSKKEDLPSWWKDDRFGSQK